MIKITRGMTLSKPIHVLGLGRVLLQGVRTCCLQAMIVVIEVRQSWNSQLRSGSGHLLNTLIVIGFLGYEDVP